MTARTQASSTRFWRSCSGHPGHRYKTHRLAAGRLQRAIYVGIYTTAALLAYLMIGSKAPPIVANSSRSRFSLSSQGSLLGYPADLYLKAYEYLPPRSVILYIFFPLSWWCFQRLSSKNGYHRCPSSLLSSDLRVSMWWCPKDRGCISTWAWAGPGHPHTIVRRAFFHPH